MVRSGSATGVRRSPRTATALIRFAPSTAPSPPRPARRPSWLIVANGMSRSPAGPIDATCHSGPIADRSRASASDADKPHNSPAGRHDTKGSPRP